MVVMFFHDVSAFLFFGFDDLTVESSDMSCHRGRRCNGFLCVLSLQATSSDSHLFCMNIF